MRYKYTLTGETPAKKNNRITLPNGKTIPSKGFRLWHDYAMLQLSRQKKPRTPLSHSIRITMSFTHGDLRKRDSDNGCTSILDLLKDAGIIQDDNWQIVRSIHVVNHYSRGNPHVEILIKQFEERED